MLGCGEIARELVTLAQPLGYAVTLSDADLDTTLINSSLPADTHLVRQHYTDDPWPLPANTHAVIARGHQQDLESVVTLLNQRASRVYLIASARRAQGIIDAALPQLHDAALINNLSAPAGIDLGGQGSGEIALSILAEIQWHAHQAQASLQPLYRLRASRIQNSISRDNVRSDAPSDASCPGKRP